MCAPRPPRAVGSRARMSLSRTEPNKESDLDEHMASGDTRGCVRASLPDKAEMGALLLGLDDIARAGEQRGRGRSVALP